MQEKTNDKELEEQVDNSKEEIDEIKEESEKVSRKDKKLKEKITELESEVSTWKNKYYQAYADMDNLRKIMQKDHQQMVKYCGQSFLESLLPVFDNFYMAFKVKPSDPTLEAYCKGFEMIYNQMVNCLESEGVAEILPSIGDKTQAVPRCRGAYHRRRSDRSSDRNKTGRGSCGFQHRNTEDPPWIHKTK